MRASRRALLLLAVLSSISVLFIAGPASAHTGFESSNPVDGSTVDMAVDEVRIAYSGAAEPAGEGFVALDSSGQVRAPVSVDSNPEQQIWTLHFDPPLTDGIIGVRWTVQAPDAHPIEGSFSFTVATTGVPSTADRSTGQVDAPATAGAPGDDEVTGGQQISSEVVVFDGVDAPAETQELQEFLNLGDHSASNAAGVAALGRLVAFVGTMIGIGGLCFGVAVVGNHRRDVRSVFEAVRYAALAVIAGTTIGLVAHLAVVSNGWLGIPTAGDLRTAMLSAFGLASGLRIMAGSLLFATARIADREVDRVVNPARPRELVSAGVPDVVVLGDAPWDVRSSAVANVEDRNDNRASMVAAEDQRPPLLSMVAVVLLLLSFTFDGHTVTEGNRWVTGAVDMIHVVAASIWAGGVVSFATVLWRRYRRRERLGGLEMALRFSVIAGAALAVAGLAGTILTFIIVESVSDLWTTAWGRLLLAKTAAVAAAAALGSYNHFVVIPWMNLRPGDDARSVRIRNTVTGEAILLALVIVLTAFLVGASSQ